jgi:hypothetical protein
VYEPVSTPIHNMLIPMFCFVYISYILLLYYILCNFHFCLSMNGLNWVYFCVVPGIGNILCESDQVKYDYSSYFS